jgi:hypothetical protein
MLESFSVDGGTPSMKDKVEMAMSSVINNQLKLK